MDRILTLAAEEEAAQAQLGGPQAGPPVAIPDQMIWQQQPPPGSIPPGTAPVTELIDLAILPGANPRETERAGENLRRAAGVAPATPGGQEVLTDSPVQTNDHPEQLITEPGTLGSAVQARQEATPIQTGLDPSTGQFVVTAPGIQGDIRLPIDLSPEDLDFQLRAMSQAWAGSDAFGADPTVSRQRADHIRNAYLALQSRLRSAQGSEAPSGPLNDATMTFSQTLGAPVSPEARARAAEAEENVRRSMLTADKAELGEILTRADGFEAAGQFRQQQADEMAREAQEQQDRLTEKLGQYEDAIRRVANRQIDPNRYFGQGAGGRMSAALAVALGAMGSALTGGPNQALQIINSAIERDIRAQETDLANARATANMQGMALSQMRSIIGDEQGARAAVRAAHLQAFLNQIDSQLLHATGDRAAALGELRRAVVEQMAADQEVARQASAFSVRQEISTRQRGRSPGNAAAQAYAGATMQTLASQQAQGEPTPSSQEGQVPEGAQPAPEDREPTALERVRSGTLFSTGEPVEIAPGLVIPGIQVNPVSEAQTAVVRSARRRLAQNPNDRGARETVNAAARRARSEQRRIERQIRRSLPRIPAWDPQDLARANTAWERYARGGSESGPVQSAHLPPGYRWLTSEDVGGGHVNGPELFHQRMNMGEAARKEFLDATRMLNLFNDIYPTVIAARRQFGGELTSVEEQMVLARQMANNFRTMLQQSRSGAALTEAELALYREMLPNPDEGNDIMWDRVHAAWDTFATMYGGQTRSILRNFGVTTDSTSGNAQQRRRALQRAQSQEE